MARGKNSVRRLDGHQLKTTMQPKPTAERYVQEVIDGIEFHWKNASLDLKNFILGSLDDLSLLKFVDYWRDRPESTSKTMAAATCGCSWYLALQYMSIGKCLEARALLLNGSFLQECYNTPIEQIASVAQCTTPINDLLRQNLRFFAEGIVAISSDERMSCFLKEKVTPDYQRRMSFATQTDSRKEKVQNYVDQISNDWETGHGSKKRDEMRRRSSLVSPLEELFIEINLVDSNSKVETTARCGSSMALKTLFKQYAEDRNVPLRRLRFTYNGGTLFLTSVGNKTHIDLNMANLDSIIVTDTAAREEESNGSSSSDESKDKTNPRLKHRGTPSKPSRRKQCRRASWAGPEIIIDMEEHLKQQHSLRMSRVFAEASPRFEQIRRRLNAMNLTCSLPKDKTCRKKMPGAIEQLDFNPSNVGLGGKAGVPFYAVHVGESDNLYKVTKPLNRKPISTDLHGLTRDEALAELDAKLPEWIDVAMQGGYPWVIPAVIICGGGNQILSEAVDQWIKNNVNVAKAPKRKQSRRGTM